MSGFPICSTVLVSRGHSVFIPDSCFLNDSVKEDMKSASRGLPSLIRRCVFIGGQVPTLGFPGGSEVKASACNAGDLGLTPGLGRSPGEGNGNPLQYSCLENPMDREAWRATVQIRSVAQLCPTLCDPMNRSMPGLPVHHQLPEFTQTHVHRVSDAIQPSHPLLSPSPLAPNPS